VDSYNKMGISSNTTVYKNGKLYCSTSNFLKDTDYFYCLDLVSGKVLWVNKVNAQASKKPIILNDVIYYITYLGDSYAYDTLGNKIWQNNFPHSLKDFTFNPINHNLFESDVLLGFYEYDKTNGKQINFTRPCDTCIVWMTLPVFIDHNMYFAVSDSSNEAKAKPEIPFNSVICQDYTTKKLFGQNHTPMYTIWLLKMVIFILGL
jgi:outer membrane protein assembly factor BamB